jgi:hypothetical protein
MSGNSGLLSGISGQRTGLFGPLTMSPQLHIKINLKQRKKLNPFNIKLLSKSSSNHSKESSCG